MDQARQIVKRLADLGVIGCRHMRFNGLCEACTDWVSVIAMYKGQDKPREEQQPEEEEKTE